MNAPASRSLAVAQRSLGDRSIAYPLWPPLTEGCPRTSTTEVAYPLEIAYDYARFDPRLFDRALTPGLDRWEPLLPPLAPALDLGEGATPLVAAPRLAAWAGFDGPVYIKDEGRNPTWSHKDRLNRCTVSAALLSGAPGIVAASSGNHGASAAAYAARAGLPCVVVTSTSAPPAVRSFLLAYGAAVIGVPTAARWDVLRDVVDRLGFQPVSNRTVTHTGHPFGPEGYKTIAYELFLQLGRRVPAAVYIPTGYAELLFGVWKGFDELQQLGVAPAMPAVVACEPGVRAPLARARAAGLPATTVDPAPTAAYSAAVTVSGYRGVVALLEDGWVETPTEEATAEAQTALTREGLWQERSGALSLAGLRDAARAGRAPSGPGVCITTSSGFKDIATGTQTIPELAPDWATVGEALRREYGIG
jgi:threonine synthase